MCVGALLTQNSFVVCAGGRETIDSRSMLSGEGRMCACVFCVQFSYTCKHVKVDSIYVKHSGTH